MADRYVVTAAHCTHGQVASGLKVAVGDTTFALGNEATSFIGGAKTIKQHPAYNPSNTQNDISVLELDQALDLTAHPNIKPICLPNLGATFANSDATVSGWGTLSSGGDLVAHLQEVDVTVFADGDCGIMDSYMTSDMMCAGVKEGGKDSCQGDSGGPLFTTDPANNNAETLIGVVSWGFGCAAPGQLGVYAEVSHFRAWIDSQISGATTCPPPGSTGSTTPSPVTTTTTTTTSGSGSGSGSSNSSCGNCVFPFTFMGVEHTACTTIDGDPKPWCSTLVDENGVHVSGGGHWEYCGTDCPTMHHPEMCVHPGNQPGSCCKLKSIVNEYQCFRSVWNS